MEVDIMFRLVLFPRENKFLERIHPFGVNRMCVNGD